jgi:hypothetical protein
MLLIKFWIETLKRRNSLEDLEVHGRNIKNDRKQSLRMWSGLTWLRIGFNDGIL